MAVVGNIIEGKYEILTLIGKGGMSEVYLAIDKNLNKQWAIKEIKKKAWDKNNELVIQSALAEANMMKKLDHPCLPRIVDIIDKEDAIYVVMDYIEGEPLNKILAKTGAQTQETVIEWAKDLCEVLDYLHTQNPPIIYRDMKPANIMLQPNGNIKLIDFGIAREYKEHNMEDTVSLGTKGYAAPEQFGGQGQTDARTDIYCLGVTLYHLLTGKNPCEPPYEIYPIRYWNAELSSGLENIILKCTQLNPEDRYQSCAELFYALMHYEEADESYRKRQKNKFKLFISTVILSILFFAFGCTGRIIKWNMNNNDYSALIMQADKAIADSDKVDILKSAIKLKPSSLEAYFKLVEAFKADASFTLEEEEVLKKVVNNNLVELKKHKEYSELAYQIGKLYWFYYDYGKTDNYDNQITRAKSAVQWFSDAIEYGTPQDTYRAITKAYQTIGEFYQNVTLNVEEASDKGTYLPYFKSLSKLVELIKDEENEIVSLEVYRLNVYSIENYSRKFKADGVSKKEIQNLFDDVIKRTDSTVITTDKTRAMKNDIQSRVESAQTAIDNAYSN